MPDKSGQWKRGMSNVQKASSVGYIIHYANKIYQKVGQFTKHLRMFAVWTSDNLLNYVQKWLFRLSLLPGWFKSIMAERYHGEPIEWSRVLAGYCLEGGEYFESPYKCLTYEKRRQVGYG